MTISTTHRTSSESLRDHFDPFAARAMSDVNVWNFCQERFVNLAARAKVWGANSLKLAWQSLRNWLEIVASWSEKRYSSLKSALKLLKAFGVSSLSGPCSIRLVKPVRREDHKEYHGTCRRQRDKTGAAQITISEYHFADRLDIFSNYPRSLKCPIAVRDYSDTCSRR